ncbi:MAG: hypothetical protein AB7T49_05730 [Oligoflexales bacterium]
MIKVNLSRGLVPLWLLASTYAFGGSAEKCYKMHNRLTGVPPTSAQLQACVSLVDAGKAEEAAGAMVEEDLFYNDTLRYMFSPWTNENGDKLVPLTDFSATAIGMVRDDVDWRQFLQGDLVYTCEGAAGLTAPSLTDNTHYEECGAQPLKTALLQKQQTVLNPALAGQTTVPAGVYTTRGFAEAYYIAGTNRAAIRFSLMNFMCEDIDAFHDTSIADFRVRQDVDRIPGGSSKTFINECKGCHSGMDPLAGAFAHLDWDEDNLQMVFAPDSVVPKFFNNADVFPDGYVTKSDEWMNFWTKGHNARVGWPVASEGEVLRGNGPKSLGKMFSETQQYSSCMAKTVYKTVCMQDQKLDEAGVQELSKAFAASGYKVKTLFKKAAASCME